MSGITILGIYGLTGLLAYGITIYVVKGVDNSQSHYKNYIEASQKIKPGATKKQVLEQFGEPHCRQDQCLTYYFGEYKTLWSTRDLYLHFLFNSQDALIQTNCSYTKKGSIPKRYRRKHCAPISHKALELQSNS